MNLTEKDYFLKAGFSTDQYEEIREGKAAGLNVVLYANKSFLPIQMRQIRLGLQEGLPVESYAKIEYDWFQMEEIRRGLKAGVDTSVYAAPEIPYEKMRQLRKGLEAGMDLSNYIHLNANIIRQIRKANLSNVDLSGYIEQGYDAEQLCEIRYALEKEIELDNYITVSYRAASIAEIRTGLEHGVAVEDYASMNYNWQQMREIRKGMEHRLDVEQYISPLYSWQQMREIRLGLEQGLDVSEYRRLRYTAHEMRRKRLAILDEIHREQERILQSQIKSEDFLFEFLANDMEVYITVLRKDKQISRERLLEILEQNNIRRGVQEDAVELIVAGEAFRKAILIARGEIPRVGANGYYEFFFRTDIERKPRILEDGTADYRSIQWFEMVKAGQVLAKYHEAEEGVDGYNVTGGIIKARKGIEQRILTGQGFILSEDKKTYTAAIDGMIRLDGNEMKITDHMMLDEVNMLTGDVQFNGSLHVLGDVGYGAVIKATGDVVIDGTVESATIESSGSIVLKKGMNSAGHGLIRAGGDVVSRFFESVKVIAKGNIDVGKCLNSQLYAEGNITSSGIIAGGVARAGAGFRIKHAGNQIGLHTALQLKVDEKLREENRVIKNAIRDVSAEVEMLNKSYEDFKAKFPPEVRSGMEMFAKVEKAVFTKKKQLEQLVTLDEEIERTFRKMSDAKVIITGRAYEGTVVEMEGCRWAAENQFNIIIRKKDDQVEVLSS
ncbi:MAG: DUF342 domain-containing protein [Lachnospiraceae bacterium]|nr:DUF342 domain-containing protein [Lachnospiraceae bacterium]